MLRAKRSSPRDAAVFGEALSPPGYRGRIHPRYDCIEMRESLAAGTQILERPGVRFLDSSRNRIGVLCLRGPGGRPLECVVKEFRPRGVDRLKSAALASKAAMAWRGSLLLQRAGVNTPFPVAFLESRRGPFLDHALFVTLAVTEAREIREPLRTLQGEALDQLVSSLAAFVKICHRKGVWHRDLSDGNILVGEGAPSAADMVLLDTNRIRETKRIGSLRGVKNLIRLGVPSRSQRKFLGSYLNPDPWSQRLWMWYRLNKTMFSTYTDLKSKLHIRELVRRLKIQ
jgi:hypothetical protein